MNILFKSLVDVIVGITNTISRWARMSYGAEQEGSPGTITMPLQLFLDLQHEVNAGTGSGVIERAHDMVNGVQFPDKTADEDIPGFPETAKAYYYDFTDWLAGKWLDLRDWFLGYDIPVTKPCTPVECPPERQESISTCGPIKPAESWECTDPNCGSGTCQDDQAARRSAVQTIRYTTTAQELLDELESHHPAQWPRVVSEMRKRLQMS
jgi:hypothetical protein